MRHGGSPPMHKPTVEAHAHRFGPRIRAPRLELGWTLERLAEAVELHPTYVGQAGGASNV